MHSVFQLAHLIPRIASLTQQSWTTATKHSTLATTMLHRTIQSWNMHHPCLARTPIPHRHRRVRTIRLITSALRPLHRRTCHLFHIPTMSSSRNCIRHQPNHVCIHSSPLINSWCVISSFDRNDPSSSHWSNTAASPSMLQKAWASCSSSMLSARSSSIDRRSPTLGNSTEGLRRESSGRLICSTESLQC